MTDLILVTDDPEEGRVKINEFALGVTTAFFTVAANGSNWGTAQYQCDGLEDDVDINAAMNQATDLPNGGTVLLSDGTFLLRAGLSMRPNVRLVLSRGTIIKAEDGYTSTVLINFSGAHRARLCGDGIIDGNKANQPTPTPAYIALISISGASLGVIIEGNLRIINAPNRGILAGIGTANVIIRDVWVDLANGVGIEVNADSTIVRDVTVTTCGSIPGTQGILIRADFVHVVNPRIENTIGTGLEFNNAKACSVRGGVIRDCGYKGIRVMFSGTASFENASNSIMINGVTVENCLDDGIYLNYVSGFSVTGCHVRFNGNTTNAANPAENFSGNGLVIYRSQYGSVVGNHFVSNSQGQIPSGPMEICSGMKIFGTTVERPTTYLTIGHNVCNDKRVDGGFTAKLRDPINLTDKILVLKNVVGNIPLDGNFSMSIDNETVIVTSIVLYDTLLGYWSATCLRAQPNRADSFKAELHPANANCVLKRTQKYGIDLFDDKTQVNHYTITSNILMPNQGGPMRNLTGVSDTEIVRDNIDAPNLTSTEMINLNTYVPGTLAVSNNVGANMLVPVNMTIKSLGLYVKTAPSGGASKITVDIRYSDNGLTFTSIFSTLPVIEAGVRTYLTPPVYSLTDLIVGMQLGVFITTVGSSTPGSDLTVQLNGTVR